MLFKFTPPEITNSGGVPLFPDIHAFKGFADIVCEGTQDIVFSENEAAAGDIAVLSARRAHDNRTGLAVGILAVARLTDFGFVDVP